MRITHTITALALFCSLLLASAAAGAADLVVTFAGDYGATADTKNVLHRIGTLSPDLHFAIGDFSYSQLPEPKWCALVHSYVHAPFLLISGNHESKGEDGDIAQFAKCLPYSYETPLHGEYTKEYYLDAPKKHPLVRFIMISPDIQYSKDTYEYTKGSAHAKWLDAVIADGRNLGVQWIVVGMHKVCINTEQKKCEIGQDLADQLIKAQVDVVMAGHVHAYERTHPLTCMKAGIFDAACVAPDAGNVSSQGHGTYFVTSGTGGASIRALDPGDTEAPYFAKNLGAADGHYFGVTRLVINDKEIKEQFIEAKTGQVLDAFTVRR